MSIVFCADSVIDATEEYFSDLNLKMIGHGLVIDGTEFFDGNGKIFPSEKLYKLLREGAEITTLQGNIDQMYDVFRSTLNEGNDLIFISFSSALSGTYQTACMVASEVKEEFPLQNIKIIDSKCAAAGQKILVEKAILKSREDVSFDELVSFIEEERQCIHHYAVIDDLEHLKKGGRISKTSALVGGLVGIKPLVHILNDGSLVPYSRARGMQNAFNALITKISENILYGESVYISHADNLDSAIALKDRILNETHVNDVKINYLGNTIGCHVGPNGIGIFFKGIKK